MTVIYPQPFQSGFRLLDGNNLDLALAYPQVSTEDTITAHAGGTQAAAYQLLATISRVTVVATAADSVALPVAQAGMNVWVINDDSTDAMQVFGNYAAGDTINAIATGTGLSQPAGTIYQYTCTTAGAWITKQVSGVFTNVTATTVTATTVTAANVAATTKLTYSGVRVGTFTCNGATNVTTANTLVTANSMILITLKTAAGTVGAIPAVQAITGATSFVTKGTASDTSVYNYALIESA